jgi:hypothetical protein
MKALLIAYAITIVATCAAILLWRLAWKDGREVAALTALVDVHRRELSQWQSMIEGELAKPEDQRAQITGLVALENETPWKWTRESYDTEVAQAQGIIESYEGMKAAAAQEAQDARGVAWSATWLAGVGALTVGVLVRRRWKASEPPA